MCVGCWALFCWRLLLNLVADAAKTFCKTKITLMRMSDIVQLVLSQTARIRGDEHYWIVYMIPGILKKLSDIGIFTRQPESRTKFCSQLSNRMEEYPNQHEKEINKNDKK